MLKTVIKLTRSGCITIPVSVRRILKLSQGDKLSLDLEKDWKTGEDLIILRKRKGAEYE